MAYVQHRGPKWTKFGVNFFNLIYFRDFILEEDFSNFELMYGVRYYLLAGKVTWIILKLEMNGK